MNLRFSRLHLHVAVTRRSNCRSLGPAIEQRGVGNRRSLNTKVLLLLATFRAVKCLFSHNNWTVSHHYYRFASSPYSLCPSKGYLTNILPEISCIGGRSVLCCSFANAAPASCIYGYVCLSACLSLSTMLIIFLHRNSDITEYGHVPCCGSLCLQFMVLERSTRHQM